MGFTVFYTSLLVLIPLAGLFFLASRMTCSDFVQKALLDPRVLSAYRLSFGASFIAALIGFLWETVLAMQLFNFNVLEVGRRANH